MTQGNNMSLPLYKEHINSNKFELIFVVSSFTIGLFYKVDSLTMTEKGMISIGCGLLYSLFSYVGDKHIQH